MSNFDSTLIQVLLKKRRTDLGTIRYLLLTAGRERARIKNKVEVHFLNFLGEFSDFEWLVSDNTADKIRDIYTRYRNGGVHEHVVTYDTCQEAIQAIVLGEDPLLLSLLKATSPNQG